MRSIFKITFLLLFGIIATNRLRAQFIVTGTVFDSSKVNLVEGVKVVTNTGMFAFTDSMGHYSLRVHENDSITFVFRNKPTPKYAVKDIPDINRFDIWLHIPVRNGYNTLKEVVIHTKTFRQDSIENRQKYADVFDRKKPGLYTDIGPSGIVGADLDEIINLFRFQRNKRLKSFQKYLQFQEKERYVTYRFSSLTVQKITGLQGKLLDSFLVKYRPSYEFIQSVSEAGFNQYILNCYYKFKIGLPDDIPAKKEEVPVAKKPE